MTDEPEGATAMTLQDLARRAPAPLALAGVGAIMWAMFVGYPMLGQLAWSKEGDEPVETKIQTAMKPIVDRLDKIEEGLTLQAEVSNSLLLELTEKTLTEINRRRCSAATLADRDYWQSEMNKLKPRYLKYSGGVAYEQRNCSDL